MSQCRARRRPCLQRQGLENFCRCSHSIQSCFALLAHQTLSHNHAPQRASTTKVGPRALGTKWRFQLRSRLVQKCTGVKRPDETETWVISRIPAEILSGLAGKRSAYYILTGVTISRFSQPQCDRQAAEAERLHQAAAEFCTYEFGSLRAARSSRRSTCSPPSCSLTCP